MTSKTVSVTYWHRRGLFYYSTMYWYRKGREITTTRKLNFVNYHLIRLIHGEKKLRDMALKFPTKLD
jgi:hypothetical protein